MKRPMAEEHPSTKRLHAIVRGHVQGVNFRAYTQLKANALGLTGWVRNITGGAVETIAEGSTDALEEFARFLHEGSPSASVSGVEESWGAASGEFHDFHVRYF